MIVIGDPQGATFIASTSTPQNKDLDSEADAAVGSSMPLTAQAAGGSGIGVPSQDMSATNAVPAERCSCRATRFQWRRPMRK
jgi:hypothetical protein